MLSEKRIKEAESNVKRYLAEELLKRQRNETAISMYIENSDLSLETAQRLLSIETATYKPYLWVIVASYYAMYYIANAVLLNMDYKVGSKISHKITGDALIAFARDKLKKGLIEEYEDLEKDALELISSRTDVLLDYLDLEREKRSRFQYQMDEIAKSSKAQTSMKRAKEFVFELKKLL